MSKPTDLTAAELYIESNYHLLSGIVVPLVTPLTPERTVDLSSLGRLVERVISAGVDGLFVLGSTGEASSLSIETRTTIVRNIAEAASASVPFAVNVSDTALDHSLRLADEAAQAGAVALALSPPSYFPLDQQQLKGYVAHFCSRSPLPVFLYNIPQFAHTAFSPQTVSELSELPNVCGVKNSDGRPEYLNELRQLLRHPQKFTLLVGNEEVLFPALEMGAHGGICGGANMFPQLFVALIVAVKARRKQQAECLQQAVTQIAESIYRVGSPETSYLRGLKRALQCLGFMHETTAWPLQHFNRAELAEFDSRYARVIRIMRDLTAESYFCHDRQEAK